MRTFLSILLSIFSIISAQAKEKVVAKPEVKELTKEQVYSTLKAAHDWYTMENYVTSAKYFDDAAKYIKDNPGELYDAMCSYSLAGQKEKAIETFKSVIGTGWDNYDHISKDTDLNNIREEPGFKALMDTLLNKIKVSEKKRAFWKNPGEKTKIGGKEFEVVGVPGDTIPMTAARVLNLQVFNDEIYLGYGDGVNNMGPVAVMSFRPDKGEWNYHFMAQEHAIVNFRQIGDELYIMGGKPYEGFTSRNFNRNFDFGSIFRLFKNGSFVKYHSIPRTLNVQDVAKLNDKFFCTAGTANEDWSQNLGCIYESNDNCASWKPVYNLEPLKDKTVRASSMKEFNGKVYAFGFSFFVPKFGEQVFVPDALGEKEAMVYDGKNWSKENIITEPGVIMLTGADVFNNQLILNVGFYDIPPQRISKLYAYNGKGKAVKVFDGEELMIDDMFIADGTLYLLLNKEENRAIVSTTNLKDFKTILEFPKEVGVSCLAVHKGYIYLGTPRGSVLRAKM